MTKMNISELERAKQLLEGLGDYFVTPELASASGAELNAALEATLVKNLTPRISKIASVLAICVEQLEAIELELAKK